jgi:ubiquitin-protein ligase E3 C
MWRTDWDNNERNMTEATESMAATKGTAEDFVFASHPPAPYATADQCLTQLRLLVQFVSTRRHDDILRLLYFVRAFEQTFRTLHTIAAEGEWTKLLKRLAKSVLHVLRSAPSTFIPTTTIEILLRAVMFLTGLMPKQMATLAETYYDTMAFLTTNMSSIHRPKQSSGLDRPVVNPELLQEAVLALLRPITSETMSAYESFAVSYLTIPSLESYLGNMDGLAGQINYRMLALAISARLGSSMQGSGVLEDIQARTWLLSYLIYFQQHTSGTQNSSHAPEPEFVIVVSDLLTSTSTFLVQGFEAEDSTEMDSPRGVQPLHPFIKEQINSLINQSSVTGLLSRIRSSPLPRTDLKDEDSEASKEARVLAKYALNLLRIFPRRGDDIRMWLYLGSAPSGEQIAGQPDAKIPAIKYFWQATSSSRIFQIISSDSTKVLPLLLLPQQAKEAAEIPQDQRDQEWTTILLFLELYTFVLKVMDDDEFFSSTTPFTSSDNTKISWTRESALPLRDIKDMTIFLKNLAFTLYWNAVDLSEPELGPTTTSLSSYFSSTTSPHRSSEPVSGTQDLESRTPSNNLAGVTGIPLEYFKGLVTGLLRMLHERE